MWLLSMGRNPFLIEVSFLPKKVNKKATKKAASQSLLNRGLFPTDNGQKALAAVDRSQSLLNRGLFPTAGEYLIEADNGSQSLLNRGLFPTKSKRVY